MTPQQTLKREKISLQNISNTLIWSQLLRYDPRASGDAEKDGFSFVCSKADAEHYLSNPASHQKTLLILQQLLMSATQCTCPYPCLPSTQASFFTNSQSPHCAAPRLTILHLFVDSQYDIKQKSFQCWASTALCAPAPAFPSFSTFFFSSFSAAPLCRPPPEQIHLAILLSLRLLATQSNRIKGQKDVSSMTLKPSSASTSFYTFHTSVPALSLKARNYFRYYLNKGILQG